MKDLRTHRQFIDALVKTARFNLNMLEKISEEANQRSEDDVRGIFRDRAMALYYSRNDSVAISALNALVSMEPSADGYATLAQAQFRADQGADALASARAAINLDPNAYMGFQVAAAACLKMGDFNGAQNYAKEAGKRSDDPRNRVLLDLSVRALETAAGRSSGLKTERTELSWMVDEINQIPDADKWLDLPSALPLALAAEVA